MKTIGIDCRELCREKKSSIGLVVENILTALRGYKYRLILFSPAPLPDIYLGDGRKNIVYRKNSNGGLRFFRYQFWLKKEIRKHPIDVFYQENHTTLFRYSGVKTVTTIHDLYKFEGLEKRSFIEKQLSYFCMRKTLKNSDRIIVVSEFTKDRLKWFFGKYPTVQVVYNGIERPLDFPNTVSPIIEGKYILVLGRLTYWKGVTRLVELYYKYLLDSGYKLVLVGKADEIDVKKEVDEYRRKTQNIIWVDYVSNFDRENLLQCCSMLCYPSIYDGFGLPPLEAAIRKKKCLMNDISVLREVTKGAGNYVDYYGNDKQVAARIKIELNRDNCEQIEELYKIASSYTWAERVKCLLDIFRQQIEE